MCLEIDLDALIGWKSSVVDCLTGGLDVTAKQRKVAVVWLRLGSPRLPHRGSVTARSATYGIIAAGSEPAMLGLPDDPRVLDSTAALSPDTIPKRLLVIGGGIIGLEMACLDDALGSRVTVLEMLDQLMSGCDPDLVRPLGQADRRPRRGEPHRHVGSAR